ncbi:MAG: hypothetical protein AB7G10_09470 [Reyranellaceae bacterium]
MTQDDGSGSAPDAFGRALWQRAKASGQAAAPSAAARPVGDAMIAAWLDGRLPEADAARVERYLVEHPQALQTALDTHNALADARRAPVPDRVVVRAQALVGFAAERRASGGGLAGLFGSWRRALEMAAVGAAFVVVIAGGFSLGGFTQEVYAQSARSRDAAVELILNPLGAFNLPPDMLDMNEPGRR